MKKPLACVTFAVLAAAACSKDQPVQQPQPFAGPTGTYPPATATATTTAPVATTPVVQPPNPLSPPCQQLEGTCAYARCNLQVGRCAWPCNTNDDCIAGATCVGAGTPLALCTPSLAPH